MESEKMRTLMDQYEDAQHAEWKLEQAVLDAFGGDRALIAGAIPFEDWSFDTYDSSVELKGTTAGMEPPERGRVG